MRVLIVEDSSLMRKELARIIDAEDGLEVAGVASDGRQGVEKARLLLPDVVTIDLNLPEMDGITCLQYIMLETPRPCLIISAYAGNDSLETFEALELGAVDFVRKPSGEISRNIGDVGLEIVSKIKAAAGVDLTKITLPKAKEPVENKIARRPEAHTQPDRAVVIGVSTGGPRTLMQIVPSIPPDIGAPVVIVQHMPENYTRGFAERLDKYSFLSVKEAENGEPLLNNWAYVAPGNRNLTVVKSPRGPVVEISEKLAGQTIAPSVNMALDSATAMFGKRTVGVVLTGMANDGADAMERLYRIGGPTIAESEETAIIYGMPKEVVDRGAATAVVPAYKIAEQIEKALESIGGAKKK